MSGLYLTDPLPRRECAPTLVEWNGQGAFVGGQIPAAGFTNRRCGPHTGVLGHFDLIAHKAMVRCRPKADDGFITVEGGGTNLALPAAIGPKK